MQLLSKTLGDRFYAEIMRKVKGDPTLSYQGENVARIRRTQMGEVFLEFREMQDERTLNYQNLAGR